MRLTVEADRQRVTIVLSRRNLLAMLAKLDGHPPDSACELFKGPYDGWWLHLGAEPDEGHYRREEPMGRMHPATEAQLKR